MKQILIDSLHFDVLKLDSLFDVVFKTFANDVNVFLVSF